MDKEALKSNVTNTNQWTRILYMLLFGIILYFVMMVLGLVVFVQAIFALATGNPNSDIRNFSVELVNYLRQTAEFLTYNTDVKPYPFTEDKTVNSAEGEIIEAEFETPVSEDDVKPDTKPDV